MEYRPNGGSNPLWKVLSGVPESLQTVYERAEAVGDDRDGPAGRGALRSEMGAVFFRKVG